MNALHKHIPALQHVAARLHPEDDDAQEAFVIDHLAVASNTLALAGDHRENALEALESFDVDEPAPVAPVHVNAPRTESPKDAPAPVAKKTSIYTRIARKATAKKKR